MLNNTSKVVMGFLIVLLGAVLITEIAMLDQAVTTTTNIANESVDIADLRMGEDITAINISANKTIANAPSGWKVSDCPISGFVLRNSSGATMTVTTDYTFNTAAGQLVLTNTSLNFNESGSNATTVTYDYCGDDYINTGWARTILDLVPGFFVLAILGGAIWLFYSIAKENGII